MSFDSHAHHVFRGQLIDITDAATPIGICLQNRGDYIFFFMYEGRKAIRFYLDAKARAELVAQLTQDTSSPAPSGFIPSTSSE